MVKIYFHLVRPLNGTAIQGLTSEENIFVSEVAARERGRLLNYIRRNIPNRYDAEDILQDVFYQLLRGFNDIRETERITSWLFTVARNRITDYFRKRKPDHLGDKRVGGKDEDGTPLMLEEILPAIGRDPEDEMMREMIWDQIEKALDEMPGEQREVFIWNEFEDKSFRDMAEATGIGINTLLSRKRYAILHLRKKLKALYNQI